MNKCALCENTGKERSFFIEDQSLCDSDYIDYLEFILNDMNEDVPIEIATKALTILRVSRKLEPKSTCNRQFTAKINRRR